MKLDPVFVLAPKPATPPNPTRRAFVLVGTGFALGATLGGACGYAAGAAAAKPAAAEDDVKPSGDADLDELRRLAVKAPIEELVAQRMLFVSSVFTDYPKDEVLWRGIKRLCDAVLDTGPFPDRSLFARALANVIEQGDPALTREVIGRVNELKSKK